MASTVNIDSICETAGSMESQLVQVRQLVDQLHDEYQSGWRAQIIMNTEDYSSSALSNLDALQFAGKGVSSPERKDKFFCPLKYPTIDGFEGNGYKALFQSLLRVTGNSGFNIIKKGYTLNKAGKHARIVCSRYETYRGDKNLRQELSFRNFSYHNDRKNTRGKQGVKNTR